MNRMSRTWHAGKPKKKPDYDPDAVTKELLDAAVEIYTGRTDDSGNGADGGNDADASEHRPLRAVSEELEARGYGSINPAKIRKLLITAHAYSTPTTEQIGKLRADGHSIEDIMKLLNISKSAVNNNLPYTKIIYKMDEIEAANGGAGGEVSVNADRVRIYKKRKRAVEKLKEEVNGENLWNAVVAFEGYPLKTTSGLDFTYEFKLNRHGEKGNEIVVSRKEKTITRSSVEKALESVMKSGELPARMSTPKELGTFGASYIYPLFIRFGLVEHIGSHSRGGPRKGKSKDKDNNKTELRGQ